MLEPRLEATFVWDEPARLLPTRRDIVSNRISDRLDAILQKALQESEAMGPGAPTPALKALQREFHEVYGQFLSHNLQANNIHPTCGKGCSHCCCHYVTSAHALEVLAIYEHLQQRPELEAHMAACAERVEHFEGWQDFCDENYPEKDDNGRENMALDHYFDERHRCPFLEKTGACGIYEVRPLTCRMYLAETDPLLCTPEGISEEESSVFTIPPDESVVARIEQLDEALDYWGHSLELFRSLSKLHAWRKRWGKA